MIVGELGVMICFSLRFNPTSLILGSGDQQLAATSFRRFDRRVFIQHSHRQKYRRPRIRFQGGNLLNSGRRSVSEPARANEH